MDYNNVGMQLLRELRNKDIIVGFEIKPTNETLVVVDEARDASGILVVLQLPDNKREEIILWDL